jgi:FKBP-type peptidyl-prolyl cis-trans isomerase FklB
VRFKVSGLVNGFATAMLHMHRGETWLVYIPYSLGYGSSVSNSLIPAYSTLIFKVTLHEFAREGKALPKV